MLFVCTTKHTSARLHSWRFCWRKSSAAIANGGSSRKGAMKDEINAAASMCCLIKKTRRSHRVQSRYENYTILVRKVISADFWTPHDLHWRWKDGVCVTLGPLSQRSFILQMEKTTMYKWTAVWSLMGSLRRGRGGSVVKEAGRRGTP